MENKLKKIIMTILVCIIIILIMLAIIISLNKENISNIITNNSETGDPGEEINFENSEIHNVSKKEQYYNVKNCINSYNFYHSLLLVHWLQFSYIHYITTMKIIKPLFIKYYLI